MGSSEELWSQNPGSLADLSSLVSWNSVRLNRCEALARKAGRLNYSPRHNKFVFLSAFNFFFLLFCNNSQWVQQVDLNQVMSFILICDGNFLKLRRPIVCLNPAILFSRQPYQEHWPVILSLRGNSSSLTSHKHVQAYSSLLSADQLHVYIVLACIGLSGEVTKTVCLLLFSGANVYALANIQGQSITTTLD